MRIPLAVMFLLLSGLVAAIVVLLLSAKPGTDIPLELAKALLSLAVAIIVTGIISYSLGRQTQREVDDKERATTQLAALRDLKASYEDVSVARFFLSASPTATMFERQLPVLMAARARLQKVQRERYVLDTVIDGRVQEMLDYLRYLGVEYRDNFSTLTRLRLREESELEAMRTGAATEFEPARLDVRPEFAQFSKFIDDDQWKVGDFQVGYEEAKLVLQAAIRSIN